MSCAHSRTVSAYTKHYFISQVTTASTKLRHPQQQTCRLRMVAGTDAGQVQDNGVKNGGRLSSSAKQVQAGVAHRVRRKLEGVCTGTQPTHSATTLGRSEHARMHPPCCARTPRTEGAARVELVQAVEARAAAGRAVRLSAAHQDDLATEPHETTITKCRRSAPIPAVLSA